MLGLNLQWKLDKINGDKKIWDFGCPKSTPGFKFKEDSELVKLSKFSESSSESSFFDSLLFITGFGLFISLLFSSFFLSLSLSLSLSLLFRLELLLFVIYY